MPRSQGTSVENNFSKGLVTEATAMNFPENSVVETDNCVYLKNGTVLRRNGIDYEDSFVVHSFADLGVLSSETTPDYTGIAINEFEWTTLNEDNNTSLLVVQLGDVIRFFAVGEDNSISGNLKSFSVSLGDNLSDAGLDITTVAARKCSFSTGLGYLFVVHPLCDPFYVEYDSDTDTITSSTIEVKTRDFRLIEDSSEIDERPATLSDEHKYNIFNRGWYANEIKSADDTYVQVTAHWFGKNGNYPSSSDIWWLWKNSEEKFDPLLNSFPVLSASAPAGHYLFSAWQTDRTNGTGEVLVGVEEDSSSYFRPSVTSFFSSRIWFAGVNYKNYSSNIDFSKIIEEKRDFGVCYQVSDPTSENYADLQETDGGVIVIPDALEVVGLLSVGKFLIVFATNGIWSISGAGTDGGFKANDYSIKKLSSTSVTGQSSMVIAETQPFWWSRSGIYTVQIDPSSGELSVVNLSDDVIKTHLLSVPADNVDNVKGVYNGTDKTIQWCYRSTASTSVLEQNQFDKLLVLDLRGQSFSIHTISSSTPKISGSINTTRSTFDPLVNDKSASTTKFITTGTISTGGTVYGVTFSQFKNTDYKDWFSYDSVGVNFESYFITGYRVRAELLKKFQSNYVVVITKTIEDGSCLVQGIWDYHSSDSGKATLSQQVYRGSTDKDYVRRKLKIRGNGYSLQFKFRSQEGKPFELIGWVASESAGNVT